MISKIEVSENRRRFAEGTKTGTHSRKKLRKIEARVDEAVKS